MHERALPVTPEKRHDLRTELRRPRTVRRHIAASDRIGHVRQRLQRLHQQHLLETRYAAGVVQRLGRPVDEHPVARPVVRTPIGVEPPDREVHQRDHAIVNLLQEDAVACVEVVFANGQEPVERIVHYLVDVHHDRIAAALVEERVLGESAIAEKVIAHEIALPRIAAPRPAVALCALDVDLASRKLQRPRRHLPDAVQPFVRAAERTDARKRAKLLVHRHAFNRHAVFGNNVHVAPAARHLEPLLAARLGIDIFPLVGAIEVLAHGLGLAFAVYDANASLAFYALEPQEAERLAPEVGEDVSAANPFLRHGLRIAHGERDGSRTSPGRVKLRTRFGRRRSHARLPRRSHAPVGLPRGIGPDGRAVHVKRGGPALRIDADDKRVASGGQHEPVGDHARHRRRKAKAHDPAHALRCELHRLGRLEVDVLAEVDERVRRIRRPEDGIAAAVLDAPRLEVVPAPERIVAGIPYPRGLAVCAVQGKRNPCGTERQHDLHRKR